MNSHGSPAVVFEQTFLGTCKNMKWRLLYTLGSMELYVYILNTKIVICMWININASIVLTFRLSDEGYMAIFNTTLKSILCILSVYRNRHQSRWWGNALARKWAAWARPAGLRRGTADSHRPTAKRPSVGEHSLSSGSTCTSPTHTRGNFFPQHGFLHTYTHIEAINIFSSFKIKAFYIFLKPRECLDCLSSLIEDECFVPAPVPLLHKLWKRCLQCKQWRSNHRSWAFSKLLHAHFHSSSKSTHSWMEFAASHCRI